MIWGYKLENRGRIEWGIIEYAMDSLGCRMGLPGNGISEVKYRGDVMK